MRGLHYARELVEKGVGSCAHYFFDALGVAFFALFAVTLQGGVADEAVEAGVRHYVGQQD